MFNYRPGSGFRVFSIANIDVSFSGWFLALLVFIFIRGSFLEGLAYVIALTLSILIHEFGHAIPSKIWNLQPSILLHGFGGACFHRPADSDKKDFIIVIAGPLLQIFIGLLTLAVLLTNPLGVLDVPFLNSLIFAFTWVSILWGGINLLIPLYPLDGGTIWLLILRRFMKEEKAREVTLVLSIAVAIFIVLFAFAGKQWLIAMFIAYMGMENFNLYRSGQPLIHRGSGKLRMNDYVKEELERIKSLFEVGDYDEAIRLSHVLRSGNNTMDAKSVESIYEMLVLANIERADFDEARAWLRKAPHTQAIKNAVIKLDEITNSFN